jgi:hypothetical protein
MDSSYVQNYFTNGIESSFILAAFFFLLLAFCTSKWFQFTIRDIESNRTPLKRLFLFGGWIITIVLFPFFNVFSNYRIYRGLGALVRFELFARCDENRESNVHLLHFRLILWLDIRGYFKESKANKKRTKIEIWTK